MFRATSGASDGAGSGKARRTPQSPSATAAHSTATAVLAPPVAGEPVDDALADGRRGMARKMTMVVRPLPTATSVRAMSTLSSLIQASASSMP